MHAEVDAEFFERLSVLNDRFAANLPATLARVTATRRGIDPRAPASVAVAEIQQVLHTLAGSAATFGFRALGQHARPLEQRLRVFTTFDAVAPEDWEDWLAALDVFLAWAARDPKSAYPIDEFGV